MNESLQRMVTLPAGLVHDDDSKGYIVIPQGRMHGIGHHGGVVSRADDDGGLLDDGQNLIRHAMSREKTVLRMHACVNSPTSGATGCSASVRSR